MKTSSMIREGPGSIKTKPLQAVLSRPGWIPKGVQETQVRNRPCFPSVTTVEVQAECSAEGESKVSPHKRSIGLHSGRAGWVPKGADPGKRRPQRLSH